MLNLVIESDRNEKTRIIPKKYKPYAKEKKALDERRIKDGIKGLEKKWNSQD